MDRLFHMHVSRLLYVASAVVCLAATPSYGGTGADTIQTVQPVERWRLAGSIGGALLGKVTSVVLDGTGDLFVLDVKNCRIYVLRSRDGSLVRSFGQCGEGPGDIYKGQMLFLSPDNAIGIVNLLPPGIQYLGREGHYISTRGITLGQEATLVTLNRASPSGKNYVAEGLANLPDMSQVRYLSVLDETCTEIVRLTTQTVAEGGRTFMDELLLDQPRWVLDPSGVLYISDRYAEYRVDVLSISGERQRPIRRKYDRLRRSDQEVANLRRLEGKFAQGGASARMEIRHVDYHRDIEDLYLLANGRLLVLTSRGARTTTDEASMGTFDVCDGGTAPAFTIRLVGEGNPLHDAYFFEGPFLFVVTDARPPYRDCYRSLQRDVPYMTIICYDISELSGSD